jgi:hypothetical protein
MRKLLVIVMAIVILLPSFVKAAEWYERIKLKGDFRFRHETIQEEDKEDRSRWRLRFRLGLNAAVTESWSVSTRLATGSDDPVSTNQSLGGGFFTKDFRLDRAYVDFHPVSVKGLNIIVGKMGVPFWQAQKTELIWDGDLSPGGIALKYKNKPSDAVGIFLAAGSFYVAERKQDNDAILYGGQAGVKVKTGDKVQITVGGGYYDYENVKDYPGPFESTEFFGNSHYDLDGTDVFLYDYNMAEVLGEIVISMEKLTVIVYGNYVNNTDPDTLNTGYLVGGTVKHGKDKGNFKLYGNYRDVGRDAVVGLFTDSDFIGGGTDGKGVEVGASYGIAKKVDLGLTYFANKIGEDEIDYKRVQVDLKMKF